MRPINNKHINLYYTSWSCYDRNFQVKDLAKLIVSGATDISYAFYNLEKVGDGYIIKSGDPWADHQKTQPTGIMPADTWQDSEKNQAGNFGQLRKLKGLGAEFNLHLSVGGWSWSKFFSPAVSTDVSRTMLINSIIEFFKTYPFFDGIDFDWEFLTNNGQNYGLDGNIANSEDANNFKKFLTSLRQTLTSNGMSKYLGMCVTAAPEKAVFPVQEIHPLLDEIRVMSYDFKGSWDLKDVGHQANPRKCSTSSYSCEQAADFYLSKGVPSNKLLIGYVAYSRGWQGSSALGQPATGNSPDTQFAAEQGICAYHMLPRPGAVEMWDNDAKAHYSYDASKKIINTYDTVESVAEKCKIVNEKNLKGLIVWEAAGDVLPENPRSLVMSAARNLFNKNSSVPPVPVVNNPPPTVPTTPVPAPTVPSVPFPSGTPEWKVGGVYNPGSKVVYNGKIYESIVSHTAHVASWDPASTPTLWKLSADIPSTVKPPVIPPVVPTIPVIPPYVPPPVVPTTPVPTAGCNCCNALWDKILDAIKSHRGSR